jgi:hypothetical protein
MTAPIQEPNLYRHTSGLQWQSNQLFRRPSPVTTGFEIAWAWMSSVLNQDSPILNNTETILHNVSPATDCFASNSEYLYPDLDQGVIWLSDINFDPINSSRNTTGLYLVHVIVEGWDQYTGSGSTVENAIKGCGYAIDASNIDGLGSVMQQYPASGANVLPSDRMSHYTGMTGIQTAASNDIFAIAAQSSGVSASIGGWYLYVALLQTPYPGTGDICPLSS